MIRTAMTVVAAFVSSATLAQGKTQLVQHREDRWVAAINRGDVSSLAAMYEKDAWLVLPGAPPAKDRAAIMNALGALARGAKHMTIQTNSVLPIGSGIVIENGVARYQVSDSPEIRTSNYQVIWRRTSSGWKILRDMVSPR